MLRCNPPLNTTPHVHGTSRERDAPDMSLPRSVTRRLRYRCTGVISRAQEIPLQRVVPSPLYLLGPGFEFGRLGCGFGLGIGCSFGPGIGGFGPPWLVLGFGAGGGDLAAAFVLEPTSPSIGPGLCPTARSIFCRFSFGWRSCGRTLPTKKKIIAGTKNAVNLPIIVCSPASRTA